MSPILEKKSRNVLSSLVWVVLIFFLVTAIACAGRTANPVMAVQFGDRKKSCEALELEMAQTRQEITLLLPDTEKTGKNVLLGIAGAFIIVPWFFMDFSQAEQMEINALRQRYNQLGLIAVDKGCSVDPRPIIVAPKPEIGEDSDEDDEM